MLVVNAIRQRARLIIGPILGVSLVAYFAYHLVEGDRGLLAWVRLTQQIREARASLTAIKEEEEPKLQRISLLRDHIDPDLLDERARAMLNLIGPDEVSIAPRPASR
jgi:cell division protein FtsB